MTGMTNEASPTAGPAPANGKSSVTVPADSHRGFDCGCGQSCQATVLSAPAVVLRGDPPPAIRVGSLTQPPSIVRAPLLPPPERMTA